MLLRLICFARKVFMHHHRIIVAAVAVAALTVGCHSTGSTSAPTPAPSASTVSASPAPSPTPTAGAISATDAENIYRTLHTNVFELEKKGGLVPGEPAPATLSNYATGQALKAVGTNILIEILAGLLIIGVWIASLVLPALF